MDRFCIDLGASDTRFGYNEKVEILTNGVVFLNDNLSTVVDIIPSEEDIFRALEIKIEKKGVENNIFPAHVLMGEMAERYGGTVIRPSIINNKSKQRVNYISAVVSIAIAKLQNDTMSDDISLYVALPPNEVNVAKDSMEENLVGEYTVEFPKLKKEVSFKICEVGLKAESCAAIVSYMFNKDLSVDKEKEKFFDGVVMSLDIGASTSDITIIKDGIFLEKTGQTYRTGGNLIKDNIINYVRAKFGYELPEEEAELAVVRGYIKQGNSTLSIEEVVENAKKACGETIVKQMQTYFRTVDIPIQSINYIVVSGGGSLAGFKMENNVLIKTSNSVSKYITDALKEICKDVEVVEYGQEARTANIRGLMVLAKLDGTKK